MTDSLNDRLNKILPRIVADDFLSGSGIGNEIAFYIFDYPPEAELRVRDHIRFLLDHIPKQKPGLRAKHINLFDFVLDYSFLTNEERDIEREIQSQELNSGDDARLLGELIFNDVLKEQRKHRYSVNKMDFKFNRLCDLNPIGNRFEEGLLVSVISPLNDDYELFDKGKCLLNSSTEGGLLHRTRRTNAGSPGAIESDHPATSFGSGETDERTFNHG